MALMVLDDIQLCFHYSKLFHMRQNETFFNNIVFTVGGAKAFMYKICVS